LNSMPIVFTLSRSMNTGRRSMILRRMRSISRCLLLAVRFVSVVRLTDRPSLRWADEGVGRGPGVRPTLFFLDQVCGHAIHFLDMEMDCLAVLGLGLGNFEAGADHAIDALMRGDLVLDS
jgi:hypothetical protein